MSRVYAGDFSGAPAAQPAQARDAAGGSQAGGRANTEAAGATPAAQP